MPKKAKKEFKPLGNISTNINLYMEVNNLKTKDVANRLGVSEKTVGNWLSKNKNPERDNIIKLARMFETTENNLIYGEIELQQNSTKIKETEITSSLLKKVINILCPVIETAESNKDSEFKRAKKEHINLYEKLKRSEDISEIELKDVVDKIIYFYKKSEKKGIEEATINTLSLYIIIILLNYSVEELENGYFDIENIKTIGDYMNSKSKNIDLDVENQQKQTIKQEIGQEALELIAILKRTKYYEYGDFCLAVLAMYDYLPNQQSKETNKEFGKMYIELLKEIRNRYALQYYEIISEIK